MKNHKEPYIPALNKSWLTPLYDPVLRWGMRESKFKKHLVENAGFLPGFKVLDLGCGTGTLTISIKQFQPAMEVFGLDGDPAVLKIAKAKADAAGVDIQWEEGLAYQLPYPPAFFDRVISCLVVHHLTTTQKLTAFQEVRRVLKPNGAFHLLDFGKPTNFWMGLASIVIRNMEEAGDNVQGMLPSLLEKAGFVRVEENAHFLTIFGELTHLASHCASSPATNKWVGKSPGRTAW